MAISRLFFLTNNIDISHFFCYICLIFNFNVKPFLFFYDYEEVIYLCIGSRFAPYGIVWWLG